MIKKIKQTNKIELLAGIYVLLAMFFMLFIYAPTELYCYNIDEFWFDFYELLPVMLLLFFGGFLIAGLVAALICIFLPKFYQFVGLPFLFLTFLCTYIQGNFLVSNLPPMDGSMPNWSFYDREKMQSLILWVVVTIAVVALCKVLSRDNFAKTVKVISICMFLMFAVTSVSVLFMTGGYKGKPAACGTTKDQYVFSEDENYIILVLDAVDAGTMSSMLEENPEYREVFEDFTYYENMLGAYPCTGVAIPHILSGKWYENEKTFKEYEVESYNNSPIMNTLEAEGYKLGMYEYEMPYADEKVFRFSNVLNNSARVSSYLDFAVLEFKLIGIRYAPYQLKHLCLFNVSKFVDLWQSTNEDEYPMYSAENRTFYDRMNAAEITTVDEKCFKFIHIDGAHVPFQYDEKVNVVEEGSYRDNMKATLTITKEYLDKLKDAGVYDNSVIVIMADHGYAEEYDYVDGIPACARRQNPIFFVKAKNESHEMQVSQAPVSYVDLQEAFLNLKNAESGSDIFPYQEGDERERRYIYYEFVTEEHMYEYTTSGHAWDDEALVPTGNEYIREE